MEAEASLRDRRTRRELARLEVVSAWYQGFWTLLEFGMQMVLILTTGYAIALSAPVSRLIDRLAKRHTRSGPVYLVVLLLGGVPTRLWLQEQDAAERIAAQWRRAEQGEARARENLAAAD